MKDRSPRAFTLVEMIVVIAILIALVGLVLAIAGVTNRNSMRMKADGELRAIRSACERYKLDRGAYPSTADTDKLDPRVHSNPASGSHGTLYQNACRDLYKELSGDTALAGHPDPGAKNYLDGNLKFHMEDGKVRYIQDPFGYCYGYSTAAAKVEAAYQEAARTDPAAARPAQAAGYDPYFDLWSTGGSTESTQKARWVRMWGTN